MAIKDKVIVIMSASNGIGEATIKLLAEQDAKLIIATRRLNRLEAIKGEFPEADVTNYENVKKCLIYIERSGIVFYGKF